MTKNVYKNIDFESLTLRDKLAVERTSLANDRTALAYARTALALIVVAGTLIKLFTEWYFVLAGFTFAALGAGVLVLGFYRYAKTSALLGSIEKPEAENQKIPQFLVSLFGRL